MIITIIQLPFTTFISQYEISSPYKWSKKWEESWFLVELSFNFNQATHNCPSTTHVIEVRPGPYFIKVKIFLKSGFKKNWSSLSLGKFFKFQFLLTLMLILYTIP